MNQGHEIRKNGNLAIHSFENVWFNLDLMALPRNPTGQTIDIYTVEQWRSYCIDCGEDDDSKVAQECTDPMLLLEGVAQKLCSELGS